MRIQEQFDRLFKEIVEIKSYMYEKLATKQELFEVKDELMAHIDLLAQKSSAHEDEIVSTQHRIERLEDRVTTLEHRPSPT